MPIPHQQYLPLTYPNPLPDIPPGGISPHPPNPLSFPPEILILLTLLHTFYITHIPLRTKLLSALLALAFSVIEPTFYMVTREDPVTGAVDIAWDAILEGRMGRDAHTTWEQGWANLVFSGPFFLVYFWGFEGLGGGRGGRMFRGRGREGKGGRRRVAVWRMGFVLFGRGGGLGFSGVVLFVHRC
ncbi:hypothetical protein BCR33DRAFT_305547 [Rhizoclosmatium globosum]|uniref:Uncharacterized protein n=1 Tax=Rhizoclosmatium globosum TaxID=329046 RepID=A0A1Y2C587_9FUNG|nr:hypothetical protein BCR33DRAFT_305547 [Rhizoclosmatium globosum]|eukprot:ORY42191.1 hypothetical protein BCR33DRAFT_305547 [Rhizoclosmatium globosum]